MSYISGYQSQAVNLGSGGYKCIHYFNAATNFFAMSDYSAASIGDPWVNVQDSTFKPQRHFHLQPLFIPPLSCAGRKAVDTAAQFSQGNDANEKTVLIGIV